MKDSVRETTNILLVTRKLSILIRIGVRGGANRAICRHIQNLKAFFHFILNKKRSSFESLVRILVENGFVVFLGILATFDDERHQAIELRIGVIGVIDVSKRLSSQQWLLPNKQTYIPRGPS